MNNEMIEFYCKSFYVIYNVHQFFNQLKFEFCGKSEYRNYWKVIFVIHIGLILFNDVLTIGKTHHCPCKSLLNLFPYHLNACLDFWYKIKI